MSIKLRIALVFILSGFTFFGYSQCCSSGSPLGATSYGGLVEKGTMRVSSTLRFNKAEGYLEGTKKISNYGLLSHSNYLFQGLLVGYGLTHRFTLEGEFGYFYAKNQYLRLIPEKLTASGMSNGTLILKYGLLNADKNGIEVTAGGGIKFPFTTKMKFNNNVALPYDIQPSTQAFGYLANLILRKEIKKITLSFFLYNRFESNFINSSDYKYGNRFSSSLFAVKRINKDLALILMNRFDWMENDIKDNQSLVNTGSKMWIISPQFRYILNQKWHIMGIAEFPLYRNMNGKQIGYQYSASLGLIREFKLK